MAKTQTIIDIEISFLRPTQIACGWQEVEAKEWEILGIKKKDYDEWLDKHIIPVVSAPDGNMYLVDRHHMGLALSRLADRWNWESRRKNPGTSNPYTHCHAEIILDLSDSKLSKEKFFRKLEEEGMLHPFDENGIRTDIESIPKTLSDLRDDPHRALAGFARKAGAFEKSKKPYVEFAWADFYRQHISRAEIKEDIQISIAKALELSCSHEARHLPGWTGIPGDGIIGKAQVAAILKKAKP